MLERIRGLSIDFLHGKIHLDVFVQACTMLYKQTALPSAIAYQGADRRSLSFGFPLECIMDENVRRSIIAASVQFLLSNN